MEVLLLLELALEWVMESPLERAKVRESSREAR
jgi:hypothetical protein